MVSTKEIVTKHKIEYDLHIHSTISDGTLSPYQIIDISAKKGFKGISITDHDNVCKDNLTEYAKKQGLTFIYGIEFSTDINNLHILGYNINLNCSDLISYIKNQKAEREMAIKKMCENTIKLGIPVYYEELFQHTKTKTIGRPHIASLMVEKGYVNTIYEAFYKYLKKGKPVYEDYRKFNFKKVINIILSCNGIPVLAHPALLPESVFNRVFMDAVKTGLMGIEVYYPRNSLKQTIKFYNIAKELGLLITGGSDFHGDIKPDINIGSAGINQQEFSEFLALILKNSNS